MASDYLPPGTNERDDHLTGAYSEWYDKNYAENLYSFIEDPKYISITENIYGHSLVLNPHLKDDTMSDWYDSNVEAVATSYFKHYPKDLVVFEYYCENRYESSQEPDSDALYEAWRDAQHD